MDIKDNTVSAVGQMVNSSELSFLGDENSKMRILVVGNSITRMVLLRKLAGIMIGGWQRAHLKRITCIDYMQNWLKTDKISSCVFVSVRFGKLIF